MRARATLSAAFALQHRRTPRCCGACALIVLSGRVSLRSPLSGSGAGEGRESHKMASKNGGKSGSRANRPTFTDQEALLFHSQGRPGKLEVVATKPMATQRDLSLAYSPGVAVPVLAIAEDEARAYDYTTKGNFVAVITNGTAILGLGNRGALAAKPVMEGKAGSVQALCRHRLHRSRSLLRRSRRNHQLRQTARQELGRHQSRRHQGAGMLHHRAEAARTPRYPGFSR